MTETRTQTLADFLLARIADDEAAIFDGSLILDGSEESRRRERIAAGCGAKRRIVGFYQREDAELGTLRGPDDYTSWVEGRVTILAHVLLALAQPYADHPDFRQEWRADAH